VSVVVLVCRGPDTIWELTERTYRVLRTRTGRSSSWSAGALTTAGMSSKRLMVRFPQVVGVDPFRNFGQHNALLAGIRLATKGCRRHDG
jgi:hypothetical protein